MSPISFIRSFIRSLMAPLIAAGGLAAQHQVGKAIRSLGRREPWGWPAGLKAQVIVLRTSSSGHDMQ
jgi:hypothetical protein